jgi:hypothetical protein
MAACQGGWVVVTNDLKKGDRVRLITENGESIHEVLEATSDKFRTEFKPEGDKVFVFGREVHDYRSLDYDAISVLNVSATQELAKRMADLEQKAGRVDVLEQQVAELKKVVAQLAQAGGDAHVATQRVPQNGATAVAQASLNHVSLEQ